MLQNPVSNRAAQLLQQLNIARVRARFLPARHPSVRQVIVDTIALLDAFLRDSGPMTLVIRGGEIYLNGRRLPKESLRFQGLAEDLRGVGLHSVHFSAGLQEEELTRFVEVCFIRDPASTGTQKAQQLLATQPFPHLRLNQDDIAPDQAEAQPERGSEPLVQARGLYKEAIQAAVSAQLDTLRGGKINVDMTLHMVDMLQDGITSYGDAYFSLSQLREFSEYSYYHSVNVAIISMLLGKGVGLPPDAIRRLGLAAMLHDIGKVCVPQDVLDKPGRLDDKERKVMESHPLDSVRILLDQEEVAPSALAVAAQHHAKYDLTGYPDFQGFGELHFFSYICTIADVYDALRSARSYKPAMLPDKSMEIMLEGSGTTFHPILLKAFFRMVGFFPVGSAVELSTGELAVVTGNNPMAPLAPSVKLVDLEGTAIERAVNLAEASQFGEHPRKVLRAVEPMEYGIRVAEYL